MRNSVYRTLTEFLGMAGQHLTAGFDVPPNFVDIWNIFLTTNDFINANTGEFDPRHMYGTSNQDVFRWPAIKDGVDRQLLGQFMTTLHMRKSTNPLPYSGGEANPSPFHSWHSLVALG